MRIETRKTWGAKPAKKAASTFTAPATRTYIHHSVTSPINGTPKDERAAMRQLQEIAFGRGFNDISYSFIVFPSGRAYVGRGWKMIGAHTEGSNSTSHAICFWGNFEVEKPTKEALETAGKIHKRGVERGFVRKDAKILPHSKAPGAATACPGRNLKRKMRKIRKHSK